MSKRREPFLTWNLAALVFLVSTVAFFNLAGAVRLFGFIPGEALRYGGLTLATSFFIHVGIVHLGVNLVFFLLLGCDVELRLGGGRYLLLLLAAVAAGHMAALLFDPRTGVPHVGASGGVSGLLVFFALDRPNRHIGLLQKHLFFREFLGIKAWHALACWLVIQFAGARLQAAGGSAVSHISHLGGAAAGALAWALFALPAKFRRAEEVK